MHSPPFGHEVKRSNQLQLSCRHQEVCLHLAGMPPAPPPSWRPLPPLQPPELRGDLVRLVTSPEFMVEFTLRLLGLQGCADTVVGDAMIRCELCDAA